MPCQIGLWGSHSILFGRSASLEYRQNCGSAPRKTDVHSALRKSTSFLCSAPRPRVARGRGAVYGKRCRHPAGVQGNAIPPLSSLFLFFKNFDLNATWYKQTSPVFLASLAGAGAAITLRAAAFPPGFELVQVKAGINRRERRFNEAADFDRFDTGPGEHPGGIFAYSGHKDGPAVLEGFGQLRPPRNAPAGFRGHTLPDTMIPLLRFGPDLEPVGLSEVLIYQHALHRSHCHIGPFGGVGG